MNDEQIKACVMEASRSLVAYAVESIAKTADELAHGFETGNLPEVGSARALRDFAASMRSASAKQFPHLRA